MNQRALLHGVEHHRSDLLLHGIPVPGQLEIFLYRPCRIGGSTGTVLKDGGFEQSRNKIKFPWLEQAGDDQTGTAHDHQLREGKMPNRQMI